MIHHTSIKVVKDLNFKDSELLIIRHSHISVKL